MEDLPSISHHSYHDGKHHRLSVTELTQDKDICLVISAVHHLTEYVNWLLNTSSLHSISLFC